MTTETKVGSKIYIYYKYWDGRRVKSVYCGLKGLASTEEKIRAAKKKHYEAKIKRIQDKMPQPI